MLLESTRSIQKQESYRSFTERPAGSVHGLKGRMVSSARGDTDDDFLGGSASLVLLSRFSDALS